MEKCKHFEVCGLDADADHPEADLCILHSEDPNKDKQAFAEALERHREKKGDNFYRIVFPIPADFSYATFSKEANFHSATFLEKADFSDAKFAEAKFINAKFSKAADFWGARFSEKAVFGGAIFSEEAYFGGARFFEEEADFSFATFSKEAYFSGARFYKKANFSPAIFSEEAYFVGARFSKGADFSGARFSKADFRLATFSEEADFRFARFSEKVLFYKAHLKGAYLGGAHLKGANFTEAHLEGANFEAAIVDGETLIWGCTFNEDTDFTGVGLDLARVAPRLKESLKNNIRRKQWQKWYDEANCWRKKILNYVIVKPFWWISDYGSSTKRIIWCFLGLAFIFAIIYWILGIAGYFLCHYNLCYIDDFIFCSVGPVEYKDGHVLNPGAIQDLFLDLDTSIFHPIFFLRSIYFSVVTMTTLGFGDMHANSGSWLGHILLMFHVILGYVLLGALVTRFAILFSGGGPAEEIKSEPKPDWVKRILSWLKQTF